MRKRDKKIENALRETLTEVCEIALKEVNGFRWLTHFANYQNFPNSLSIVCVFDTKEHLSTVKCDAICSLIKEQLRSIDININAIDQPVIFDTEESCDIEHAGQWTKRFQAFEVRRHSMVNRLN
ncbi:MAG: hypothetical protein ACI9J2_000748 [Saprospiraceae bacterium]|jgi:hypothetical protein